jgi:hypothetical protein
MEAFPHCVTALNPATNVSKNDVAGLLTISLRQIGNPGPADRRSLMAIASSYTQSIQLIPFLENIFIYSLFYH